jgi:hypothetical protein
LALRYGKVELCRPRTSREPQEPCDVKTCDVETICLNAVFVEEINPPSGEEAVQWMLLTTREVNSLGDARHIVKL